ncbi:hypothetical protein O1611_g4272 [Lasiodiplodia mahajangana]|uniref:Uncharacterized protein n=1 Tax=Lasiodiplodia mahajangana TaxID=1108764 RepID=A0ACC2JPN5_9PEZI|nr:hypothetical protein O1611_g4272 [Lasiodiplodia mahajangana]
MAAQCFPESLLLKSADKNSKGGYAQNLFGATLTLSGGPLSQTPARHRLSKTSRAREETTSSPPSSIGNHHDDSGLAIDKVQAPTTSPNVHSGSTRQTTSSANSSKITTKASSKLRGSTRLELPPRDDINALDEVEETLADPKQRSIPIPGQEKERRNRRSALDARSTNQSLGKARDNVGALGQVHSKMDRPGEPSMIKVSNKIQDKRKTGADNNSIQGRKSQVPSIDLTDDGAETPGNQPLLDQPRTELIIKPRKKRGLLMMSERHPIRDSSPKSDQMKKIGPGAHNSPSPSNSDSVNISASGRGKKTRSLDTRPSRADFPKNAPIPVPQRNKMDGDMDPDTKDDADADADDENRLRRRRRPSTDNIFSNSANEDPGSLNSTRREDSVSVDKMPPPRLVKLGRRGINSKEVIGFIFDDELDSTVNVQQKSPVLEEALRFESDQGIGQQQQHQTKNNICDGPMASESRQDAESQPQSKEALGAKGMAVLRRQNGERPKPGNEASIAIQSEEALSTVMTTTTKQHRPLIANPATRGRKAAKPSDAAGQMPICPLPTESAGSLSLHQNPNKRNTQGNPDAGSANSMPGFSRANGGPWSREAHDLFDFKRPP